MTFDRARWKEQLREGLAGWWSRAKRVGATPVYAGLSGATLWPLVEAARGGELAPVILALGAVTGGVGANLIAGQIERWKDRTQRAGEAEVAAWIDQRVTQDANLRNAIDDILERLQAVQAAQAELGEAERRAFTEALRADLDRLGNLPRFQATLSGSGAIAQGDRSSASLLTRLECRVRPLRDGNLGLLAAYDGFFSAGRLALGELSAAVIERATELRARCWFSTPDAIHLATAIEGGADVVLTGDATLRRCREVTVEVLEP